jgi:hypothetical protein
MLYGYQFGIFALLEDNYACPFMAATATIMTATKRIERSFYGHRGHGH